MTRMTDERGAELEPYFQRGFLTEQELREVRVELDRARSEEARLLKEGAEKDATIKALADALARIEQISIQGARADVLQIKAIISSLRRDRVLP